MKRTFVSFFATALLVSCAGRQTPTNIEDLFDLEIEDRASDSSFSISLDSNVGVPLCIAREGWPDDRGRVSEVFDVTLSHDDGVLRADGYHPPQCVGGCEPIVVAPFGRIDAMISYSSFGEPSAIAKLHGRKLNAAVFADTCEVAK